MTDEIDLPANNGDGSILRIPLPLSLTEEQLAAVEAAVSCLQGGKRTLSIGGYAGTGKTTIIKSVLEKAGSGIAVCAFTGKAVSACQTPFFRSTLTLHSLMYIPDKGPDGKVRWHLRDILGDEENLVRGIIVDEASMLNTQLYEDLLSFGLPVVFVGDHGQLEPIGDNPGVMNSPEIRLEKIHRQAEKSPILRFAHAVREGRPIAWHTLPPDCDLKRGTRAHVQNFCHQYDAIICGFNKTRHSVNRRVRELRGFQGDCVPGERLICLKNSRTWGVFNGMMLNVKNIHPSKTVPRKVYREGRILEEEFSFLVLDVETDDGALIEKMEILLLQPGQDVREIDLGYQPHEWAEKREVVAADYGYALTAHKAQGSEYDKVLVIEEVWREKWDPRRWSYTAATRAAKQLTWVG